MLYDKILTEDEVGGDSIKSRRRIMNELTLAIEKKMITTFPKSVNKGWYALFYCNPTYDTNVLFNLGIEFNHVEIRWFYKEDISIEKDPYLVGALPLKEYFYEHYIKTWVWINNANTYVNKTVRDKYIVKIPEYRVVEAFENLFDAVSFLTNVFFALGAIKCCDEAIGIGTFNYPIRESHVFLKISEHVFRVTMIRNYSDYLGLLRFDSMSDIDGKEEALRDWHKHFSHYENMIVNRKLTVTDKTFWKKIHSVFDFFYLR